MITFANPGKLDVRSITTFGLNAKQGTTPIGQFGTGLKYAIATILRLGGTIVIDAFDASKDRDALYRFTTSPGSVRNKEFNFISMECSHPSSGFSDSTDLAFTTELGPHWKPWMAYRELRSNMLDEGGAIDASFPRPWTRITVKCPEIEEAHTVAANFFLETSPLWANSDVEIHPQREDGALFYRGIRVATINNSKTSVYSYNILKQQNLTEDRTLGIWDCQWQIGQSLHRLNDQEIAENILLAPYGTFEKEFDFSYVTDFSDEMRAVIRLHKHNENLNRTAKHRFRSLYYSEDFLPEVIPMSKAEREYLDEIQALFVYFHFSPPWKEICLAKSQEDGADEIVLHEDILFVGKHLLDDEDLLLRFIQELSRGDYRNYTKERLIACAMAKAHPSHPLLAPYRLDASY